MYLIVYNATNDKTLTRLYNNYPTEEVGSINGYGWEIITIQELYEKSFYTLETIYKFIEIKNKQIEKRNWRIKKLIRVVDVILE